MSGCTKNTELRYINKKYDALNIQPILFTKERQICFCVCVTFLNSKPYCLSPCMIISACLRHYPKNAIEVVQWINLHVEWILENQSLWWLLAKHAFVYFFLFYIIVNDCVIQSHIPHFLWFAELTHYIIHSPEYLYNITSYRNSFELISSFFLIWYDIQGK